jgi:hypothetical protein
MEPSKVEIINQSFDKLVTKLTETGQRNSIWDILIPLLIGAALTLLAQLAIEFWKSRKEKELKRRELISKTNAKTYLISQILKNLAMYKTQKQ